MNDMDDADAFGGLFDSSEGDDFESGRASSQSPVSGRGD